MHVKLININFDSPNNSLTSSTTIKLMPSLRNDVKAKAKNTPLNGFLLFSKNRVNNTV